MSLPPYPYVPQFLPQGEAGRVSVVVVHYRGADDLRCCVESLAAQDWADLELVLVDNGSKEGLPSLMLETRRGDSPTDLAVEVVRLKRNLGFAGGANAGATAASGEYIFFLNPDTRLQPGCIRELVSSLREGADIATARLLLAEDPSLLDNAGHGLYPDGLNWCRGRGEPAAGQYEEPEDVLLFSGAAVLFKRSALAATGGFDPDYFGYGEDADLSLRAARVGLRCRYVPTAEIHHRVGGSFGRLALRKVMLVERNRARVAITHLPWSWLFASPWWTFRRHLSMGRGLASGSGLASSWVGWRRPLLPVVVLAAHAASMLDVPGSLRRRRALGGGIGASELETARIGVDGLCSRPAGI